VSSCCIRVGTALGYTQPAPVSCPLTSSDGEVKSANVGLQSAEVIGFGAWPLTIAM
jgi:hypothetical protein